MWTRWALNSQRTWSHCLGTATNVSAASTTGLPEVNPKPQYKRQFIVTILYPSDVISCASGLQCRTYHWGFLSGRVVYSDERVVEIVQIYFALCLQFVKIVEETKCERSARADPSCWEPTSAKQLTSTGTSVCPNGPTEAVRDPYFTNTGDVEQCEIGGGGWDRAVIADFMTKLIRCTQLEVRRVIIEGAVPLLRDRSVWFSIAGTQGKNITDLEAMEGLVHVAVNDAILTGGAEPEAVKAPERSVASATTLAGGGRGPPVLRFMFDQLVGNLIRVLKPLFEVGLKMRERLLSSNAEKGPNRNRTAGPLPGLLRGCVIRWLRGGGCREQVVVGPAGLSEWERVRGLRLSSTR